MLGYTFGLATHTSRRITWIYSVLIFLDNRKIITLRVVNMSDGNCFTRCAEKNLCRLMNAKAYGVCTRRKPLSKIYIPNYLTLLQRARRRFQSNKNQSADSKHTKTTNCIRDISSGPPVKCAKEKGTTRSTHLTCVWMLAEIKVAPDPRLTPASVVSKFSASFILVSLKATQAV